MVFLGIMEMCGHKGRKHSYGLGRQIDQRHGSVDLALVEWFFGQTGAGDKKEVVNITLGKQEKAKLLGDF